jgi:hypothetical protein
MYTFLASFSLIDMQATIPQIDLGPTSVHNSEALRPCLNAKRIAKLHPLFRSVPYALKVLMRRRGADCLVVERGGSSPLRSGQPATGGTRYSMEGAAFAVARAG